MIIIYTLLLSLFSWSSFALEDSVSKSVITILNIFLLTIPLFAIIFSNIYIYNSTEFIELMLSQPIKRSTLWVSLFAGLSIALIASFLLGAGIPILLFIPNMTGATLILDGTLLTLIFVSLAMLCAVITRDKAKGIGISVILWLFYTLIFDALVLIFIFQYSDYPIEKLMIAVSCINPIDIARILVLLQIDLSALMGYTGAIFKEFFGSTIGFGITIFILLLWSAIPLLISLKLFQKKDL